MAKISVIVPVYNVEKHLRQCLDSIINQTFKDLEIIIINDGSPDKCGEIIDEYAKLDNRIIAIHQRNAGYGKVINKGLDIAKGEFIGIIESDDFIEPDMYEKMLSQIEKSNADVCKAGFYKYDSTQPIGEQNIKWTSKGQNYDRYPKGKAFKLSEYPEYYVIHASIWVGLYRKSFLKEYNIRMEETASASYQDLPFITSVLCNAKRIVLIPEYMYHWRLESNQNSSTTQKGSKLLVLTEQCEKVKQIVKDAGCYEFLKEALYKHFYFANIAFYNQIAPEFKHEYFDRLHNLLKELKDDKSFKYKYFYTSEEKNFVKNIINNEYVKTFERECKLRDKIQKIKNKRIVFWGASIFLSNFINVLNIKDSNIVGIIDKNQTRYGEKIGDYIISSPDDIKALKPDIIVISIVNKQKDREKEIKEFLKQNYNKKCKIIKG